MIGNARNKGVAPRAIAKMFASVEQNSNFAVEISVLEIYNERVRDLLAPGSGVTHLDIHEVCTGDGNTTFRCPEATQLRVTSPEEALSRLSEGMKRRETARTDMNHCSS